MFLTNPRASVGEKKQLMFLTNPRASVGEKKQLMFLTNPRALAGGKETNQKQMGFNPKCALWG